MREDVIAREGDVLVVQYPEVKVPIAKYWVVGVGGLVYTRKLTEGESVRAQYNQIMSLLTIMVDEDANVKVEKWSREANGRSSPAPMPAPIPTSPKPVSGRPVAR